MSTFCPYCFNDGSLRKRLKEIRPKFPKTLKCDFHPTRSAIPRSVVAELVDEVFRQHFVIGSTVPVYDNEDDRPTWTQRGEQLDHVLDEITSASEFEIAEALRDQLIEDEFVDPRDGDEEFYADDQLYASFNLGWDPNNEAWEEFKVEITHNRRFFNDLAIQRLEEIFQDIHLQSDKDGKKALYRLKPDDGLEIYRVRQVNYREDRKKVKESPETELGVPPPRKRSAGRMNAAGVGAFYGAFELQTCIAEIRPPVGCVVVGAKFRLARPIVVLDLTRFAKPIRTRSLFSPVFQERTLQWKFMQRFMHEISRPILPNDVNIDYIPSQAVSEFITSRLMVQLGKKEVGIDGIIFSSAQRPDGAANIVLFGDAALVEQSDLEEAGSAFEADADDWTENWTEWKPKSPEPALRLDRRSIVTRKITGAEFSDDYHSEWNTDDDFI